MPKTRPIKPLPAGFMPAYPASTPETKRFLTSFTDLEKDNARKRWDAVTGAKGLLDAQAMNTGAKGVHYTYDAENGRFRRLSNNRLVTDRDLKIYVRRLSKQASDEMRKEMQQLIAGAVILSVWYGRMREMMKSLYYTLWLLAWGGFMFDDNIARNLFYLYVLAQFNWLDNFVRQINDGTQGLDGWAVTRAGMYGRHGNGSYQNAKLEKAKIDGMEEGRRLLGENENHCHDSDRPGCIEESEKGWMRIENVLPIGEATCLSNCYCTLIFRKGGAR